MTIHDVVVVGTATAIRAAGVTDFVNLKADEVVASEFDDTSDTWLVRTRAGEEHLARVVIDAGPVPDDGAPYLGVAMPDVPNYFLLTMDARHSVVAARARYIAECLHLMRRMDSTRIEVRRTTQRLFHERAGAKPARSDRRYWRLMRKKIPTAFDFRTDADVEDDVYDGPALFAFGDDRDEVRVRLTGHVDPIDGKYHWQGMLFDTDVNLPVGSGPVQLTIGTHTAPARITEQTPWGTYSITGVGTPPFALDGVELPVPTS